MARKRALRWQLYDSAVNQGLKRRSGGYSVIFLRDFLKLTVKPAIIELLPFDPLFSPLGDFIQVIDTFEQQNDKKNLISIRQTLKRRARNSQRIPMVNKTIRALDDADVNRGFIKKKPRGSKPWQTRKQDFKDRHGLSDEDWREYKRNKLNAQRSRA